MTGRLAGQRRKRAQAGRTHKSGRRKRGSEREGRRAPGLRGRVLHEGSIPPRGMIIGGEKKKK